MYCAVLHTTGWALCGHTLPAGAGPDPAAPSRGATDDDNDEAGSSSDGNDLNDLNRSKQHAFGGSKRACGSSIMVQQHQQHQHQQTGRRRKRSGSLVALAESLVSQGAASHANRFPTNPVAVSPWAAAKAPQVEASLASAAAEVPAAVSAGGPACPAAPDVDASGLMTPAETPATVCCAAHLEAAAATPADFAAAASDIVPTLLLATAAGASAAAAAPPVVDPVNLSADLAPAKALTSADLARDMPRARRMAIGQMCKRLIDTGRRQWLSVRCGLVEEVVYIQPEISGECCLLLARP